MSELLPAMKLTKVLDPMCQVVGLVRQKIPAYPGSVSEGAALWVGAYAAVLLWPALNGESTVFVEETLRAEGWFAEFLGQHEVERQLRVMDGYLLLHLPAEPKDELAVAVRQIELSSQICRKHVVWQSTGECPWHRLDSVTVLGLPEGVTAAAGEPMWPKLSDGDAELWQNIEKAGPVAAAQAEASAR